MRHCPTTHRPQSPEPYRSSFARTNASRTSALLRLNGSVGARLAREPGAVVIQAHRVNVHRPDAVQTKFAPTAWRGRHQKQQSPHKAGFGGCFNAVIDSPKQEDGAPDGIRTHDPCLRRAVLYPAELLVQCGRHDTHLVGGRPCWRVLLLILHVSGYLDDADQKIRLMGGIVFFFSNGLLSFALAVPRIRLRFQTLLSGFPALSRPCVAGPANDFLMAASFEVPFER